MAKKLTTHEENKEVKYNKAKIAAACLGVICAAAALVTAIKLTSPIWLTIGITYAGYIVGLLLASTAISIYSKFNK